MIPGKTRLEKSNWYPLLMAPAPTTNNTRPPMIAARTWRKREGRLGRETLMKDISEIIHQSYSPDSFRKLEAGERRITPKRAYGSLAGFLPLCKRDQHWRYCGIINVGLPEFPAQFALLKERTNQDIDGQGCVDYQ